MSRPDPSPLGRIYYCPTCDREIFVGHVFQDAQPVFWHDVRVPDFMQNGNITSRVVRHDVERIEPGFVPCR